MRKNRCYAMLGNFSRTRSICFPGLGFWASCHVISALAQLQILVKFTWLTAHGTRVHVTRLGKRYAREVRTDPFVSSGEPVRWWVCMRFPFEVTLQNKQTHVGALQTPNHWNKLLAEANATQRGLKKHSQSQRKSVAAQGLRAASSSGSL